MKSRFPHYYNCWKNMSPKSEKISSEASRCGPLEGGTCPEMDRIFTELAREYAASRLVITHAEGISYLRSGNDVVASTEELTLKMRRNGSMVSCRSAMALIKNPYRANAHESSVQTGVRNAVVILDGLPYAIRLDRGGGSDEVVRPLTNSANLIALLKAMGVSNLVRRSFR